MQSTLTEEEAKQIPLHPGNQPQEIVSCPYFPEHKLRRSRLLYHILKCQKNPLAPKLVICPFNFLHRVQMSDRANHLAVCPDKPKTINGQIDFPSFNKTQKILDKTERETPLPKSFYEEMEKPDGEEEWWD